MGVPSMMETSEVERPTGRLRWLRSRGGHGGASLEQEWRIISAEGQHRIEWREVPFIEWDDQ